jgi:hypothetical protein
MIKFREVKTGSGKTAVQVYYLHHRKRVIVKHLGSTSTNEELDNSWLVPFTKPIVSIY